MRAWTHRRVPEQRDETTTMTRPILRSWLLAAIALSTGSLAYAEEPELDRGAQLLAPFKHDLRDALRSGLAEGPVHAVTTCQTRAPEVSEKRSSGDIRVGRSSHRLRNPDNLPPEWVKPIMDAYLASPSNRSPKAVTLPDSRVGYVEPILLQPPCMTCHGGDLSPDVASRINALYPRDRAVGFEVGDLRGVFWIEYPSGK